MKPGEIAYPPSPAGYTSASQVDLFNKCERAWWFRSVAKISTPSTPAQAFGTNTHGAVEHYLKGQPIPVHPDPIEHARIMGVLAEAVKHLPNPKVGGYRVEGRIEVPTYAGGPIWQGFIDLWEPNKHPPEVTDHKTTSNFRYAKTPQELAENVQMVSYAKWAFLNLNTNVVRVSHLYLLTRGKPKAHYVYVDMTPEMVDRQWQREITTVRRMTSLKVVTSSDDMTPNGVDTGHCHAYGGCPYRTQCGLSPASLITIGKTKQGDYSMSTLAEKLMAARAAAQGGAAPVASPPPPAPAPVMPVTQTASVATATSAGTAVGVVPSDAPPREQAPETIGPPGFVAAPPPAAQTFPQGSAEPVLAAPPAAPGKKRGRPSKAEVAAREAALASAPPVGGPSRPVNDLAAEPVPIAARRATGEIVDCPACGARAGLDSAGEILNHIGVNVDLESDAMVACVTSGDSPADAIAWVANRRRELAALADARIAENPATVAEPAAPAPPVAVPPRAVRSAPVEKLGSNAGEFHLYVGCMPVKGEHRDFTLAEDWLAPIAQVVAEQNKVSDWKMISYTSKGCLSAGVAAARHLGAIPRVLVIPEHAAFTDALLESLIPFAKSVTKRC